MFAAVALIQGGFNRFNRTTSSPLRPHIDRPTTSRAGQVRVDDRENQGASAGSSLLRISQKLVTSQARASPETHRPPARSIGAS